MVLSSLDSFSKIKGEDFQFAEVPLPSLGVLRKSQWNRLRQKSSEELKMKEKWNFVLYLIWFSYLIMSAVIMFGNGFLLSRKTLSDVSECVPLKNIGCDGLEKREISFSFCTEEQKIRQVLANPDAPLVCVPVQHRVLLILVDALRYDFTDYEPDMPNPLFYHNRMPVMRKTLHQWPDRTRLFRFMADPPTTTFQRVKALVTGSLPTFIDFSSNFAAMELQEDNMIDQVTKGGGKAVLLGDDTWVRLIPGRWHRTHAHYSFHTWDLDTVDYEIDKKIYQEILKDDWDILVAHYLGVDHAGHRYGPNHPEMARKLNETNMRLEKIIETLPSDVLLYVIGDHGMTETGDHGGESKAERTAAFFAYRGDGLAPYDNEVGLEVQQTDLAPSVCAALGRPAPAPSLGHLIAGVLPPMSVSQTLLHLRNNLKQITNYLKRYGEESQQVPVEKLMGLIYSTSAYMNMSASVHTKEELKEYIEGVRSIVDNVKLVFREVWVEFDSLSMLRALLLLLLAIFFNWLITEGLPIERIPSIFESSFVSTGLIAQAVCVAACFAGYTYELIDDIQHAIFLSTGLVSGAIMGALVVMHWDGISQRWFEGRPYFYERFARAALVASAAALVTNSFIIEEGATLSFLSLSVLGLMAWNTASFKSLALWVGCGVVLALTRVYRGCREEQGECWTAGGGGGGAGAGRQASRAALVVALGAMAGVAGAARRHVGWRGPGLAAAAALACAHWAVGWGSLGSAKRSRLIARITWLVLASMFALLWKRDRHGGPVIPLSVCSLLIYVATAMTLGAVYAPAAALALLSGFLALNIVSSLKGDGSNKFSISVRCNSSVACMWALLASYQFYGVGHHATLGHLRWFPAFHAGDPNYLLQYYPHATAAVLVIFVGLELFGMALMFGATVPLLALWGRQGAAALGPRTQMAAVFSLCLKFALCFAIRVFACTISATIHCHHLMVWGVFTPKLLFEVSTCAAALIGTILGAALTVWHMPLQQRNS